MYSSSFLAGDIAEKNVFLFLLIVTRPFRIAFNHVTGEDVAVMNF
jgi:hypothetical protein